MQVQDANWNNLNNVVLTPATSPYGQWTRVQFSFVAAGTSSRLSAGPFTDGLYTVSLDDFVVSASPVAGAPSHGGDKVLAKPAVNAPQQQSGGPISTRNYYFFNGTRIAMSRDPRSVNRNGERDRGRQCSGTCSSANPGTVTWLHSDLLGSATLATNASGQPLAGSEARYAPFGTVRMGGAGLPNDRRFNGNTTDIAGLLDYGARAYDPLIGRFVSADTIVPSPADPQSLNRFAYVRNSPLSLVDPTGHAESCATDSGNGCGNGEHPLHFKVRRFGEKLNNFKNSLLRRDKGETATFRFWGVDLPYNPNTSAGSVTKAMDQYMYEHFPSTVGLSLGGTASLGTTPAGAQAGSSASIACNWRSASCGQFQGYKISGAVGVMEGASYAFDFSAFVSFGGSDVDTVAGPTDAASVNGRLVPGVGGNVSIDGSVSVNPVSHEWAVDAISGQHIRSVGISAGPNFGANIGVDLSVSPAYLPNVPSPLNNTWRLK